MDPTTEAMLERLRTLYEAGEVKRLHTVPTLRPNTIAEHVYGTILIATELITLNRQLAARDGTAIDYERIVKALMVHDAPELATGDVPAPVKRAGVEISGALEVLEGAFYAKLGAPPPVLNAWEQDIAKAADTLDLGYRCLIERSMGNRNRILELVMNNVLAYTSRSRLEGVTTLRLWLARQWGEL